MPSKIPDVTPKKDVIGQLIAECGFKTAKSFADDVFPVCDPRRISAALDGEPVSVETIKIIVEKINNKRRELATKRKERGFENDEPVLLVTFDDLIEGRRSNLVPPQKIQNGVKITACLELSFSDPNDPMVALMIQTMAAIAKVAGEYSIVETKIGSLLVTLEMSADDVALFLKAFNNYDFDPWHASIISFHVHSLESVATSAVPLVAFALAPITIAMRFKWGQHKALVMILANTVVSIEGSEVVCRLKPKPPPKEPPSQSPATYRDSYAHESIFDRLFNRRSKI